MKALIVPALITPEGDSAEQEKKQLTFGLFINQTLIETSAKVL